MSDMGDDFKFWREQKQEPRRLYGVRCQECIAKLPRAHPAILLPGQRCRIHRWRAPISQELGSKQ